MEDDKSLFDFDVVEDKSGDSVEDVEEIEGLQEVVAEVKSLEVVEPKSKAITINKFDLSKLANTPGVVVGEVGVKVSRFPVERVKFSESRRSRICPVIDSVIVVKSHYTPNMGSFVCFGGECCQDYGFPSVKYLIPVVVYETDAKGRCISKNIENKVVAMGKDPYESLMIMKESFGSIDNSDIIVSCTDEKFQKIQLTPVGVCNYKTDPNLVKEVVEFWTKNMEYVVSGIARPITPAKYKELRSEEEDMGVAPSEDAFSGILS